LTGVKPADVPAFARLYGASDREPDDLQ